MNYVFVFFGATILALVVLWFVPHHGARLVRSRLGALEAAGPGLVPLDSPQTRKIQERRRAKARRKQRRSLQARWLRFVAPIVALAAALGVSAWAWGPQRAIACGALVLAWMLGLGWWRRQRRLSHVSQQMPVALHIMANHLRDTNSFFGALEAVAQQAPRGIAREFALIHAAITAGATEEHAFLAFARRNPVPEAEMVATALSVPQDRGQRLAAALFNVHEVLAGRHQSRQEAGRIERSVRLLAWVLVVPVAVVAIEPLARPEGLSLLKVVILGLFCAGTLAINRVCVGLGRGG
ncbi:type II secretion system F family protein [bacterium]|nr:type II secretion system F family protein [bacterium]